MSASPDLAAEAPKTGPFARDPAVRQRAEEMAIREVLIDLDAVEASPFASESIRTTARKARVTLRMLARRLDLAS